MCELLLVCVHEHLCNSEGNTSATAFSNETNLVAADSKCLSIADDVHEDSVSINHWQGKLRFRAQSVIAVDDDTACANGKRITILLKMFSRSINASTTMEVDQRLVASSRQCLWLVQIAHLFLRVLMEHAAT